ncbi:thioredoxin family protein [Sporosarcina sp. ACRSL]|uniref:thioredoxin family protein n=1 Tax=Sporosarcina sp. ACRSL TaxID=2918215 RepID=UPI001EF63EC1|nr:thioredoxin family protein [Sporosarcina sp. ACRSL]MCG7344722.1 thioredoxin family protein [Sporosarcina sp. ACRSL]
MTLNLKHVIGKGITAQEFMEGMQVRSMELSNIPNTKERFINTYKDFTWKSEKEKEFFTSISTRADLISFILCTDWCPDVIWNVPVLLKIMEQSQIPTEILIMEEHLETMDLFLTDGARAQPILVILKKNGDVLGRWGARPSYIQKVMDQFKEGNPKKDSDYQNKLNDVYKEIGKLYNSADQYQEVILSELQQLFSNIEKRQLDNKGIL